MQNFTENLCIICLSSNEKKTFFSLYSGNNENTLSEIGTLYQMILDKSLITTNDNGNAKMPKFLCKECENSVRIFSKFKKKVIESYNKMQNAVNRNTQKEKEDRNDNEANNSLDNCIKIEEVTVIDLTSKRETHKFQIKYLKDDYNGNAPAPASNEEIKIIGDTLNAMDYEEIQIEHENNLECGNQTTNEIQRIDKVQLNNSIICEINTGNNIQTESSTRSQKTGCLACNRIFNSEEEFEEHVQQMHQPENSNEKFECAECGKVFKKKSLLNKHKKTHFDVRRFSCEECGKRFKTRTHLKYHTYTHMDKQFKCEICNQMYSTPTTLNDHIKFVHNGLKPYSCDICGKKFTKKHKMKHHRCW